MLDVSKKKETVLNYLNKGFLVSENFFKEENQDISINDLNECLILDNKVHEIKSVKAYNWIEFDKAKVISEKKGDNKVLDKFNESIQNGIEEQKVSDRKVKVISSYEKHDFKKREVEDFVGYFNKRFDALEKILRNRQELVGSISISRVLGRKDKDAVSIIGIVLNKQLTKNGHYFLTIEDKTETIRVLVSKDKPELYNLAKDIVFDEVIGVVGVNGDKIIFANNLIQPEVPLNKELKKCSDETYALFMSDVHVGSYNFLEEEFNKFLKWINCEVGDEKQKSVASKVKYIFFAGDLVDGCGIYPGQEKDLSIPDIYKQYEKCAELLSMIPQHIEIIIAPGNHDAMRIAEPQPKLYEDFAGPILNLPNVTVVSNPGIVNVHGDENFPGFDVMLYHGYSYDYYVANVDSLRNNGGYNRADLIIKFLLQRRHLAPSHSSTLYLPETEYDPLVINIVPDIFVSGHIHKAVVSNYRNVTMISSSCWQAKTEFEEKMGHEPEPARIPMVNLQTREVKILRFG